MQNESTPIQIDETVVGISPYELKLRLSEDGTQYVSSFDAGIIDFNRQQMDDRFGRIFDRTCIEAIGNATHPTFECPDQWPCNQCSIAAAVAQSRANIANERPKKPNY